MSVLFASQAVDNYVGLALAVCLLVLLVARPRVPGAVLMSAASLVSLLVLIVALAGLHRPARALHGQGLRRRHGARRPGLPPGRAAHLPAAAGRTRSGSSAGTSTRSSLLAVQPRLGARALPVPAGADLAAARQRPAQRRSRRWPSTPRSASSPTPTGSRYSGESTMGHLVQMAGLAVQNFVSAAVGMAIAVGAHPRPGPPTGAHARQLLGRPHPHDHCASCCRSRS